MKIITLIYLNMFLSLGFKRIYLDDYSLQEGGLFELKHAEHRDLVS